MDERWWIGIIAMAVGAILVVAGSIALLRFLYRLSQQKADHLQKKSSREKNVEKEASRPLLASKNVEHEEEEQAQSASKRDDLENKSSYSSDGFMEPKAPSNLSRRKKAEVKTDDDVRTVSSAFEKLSSPKTEEIPINKKNLETEPELKKEEPKKEQENLIDFNQVEQTKTQKEPEKELIEAPIPPIQSADPSKVSPEPAADKSNGNAAKSLPLPSFSVTGAREEPAKEKEDDKTPSRPASAILNRPLSSKLRPSSARRLGATAWEEDTLLSDDGVESIVASAENNNIVDAIEEEYRVLENISGSDREIDTNKNSFEVPDNKTEDAEEPKIEVEEPEIKKEEPVEEKQVKQTKEPVVASNWLDLPDDALEKLIQLEESKSKDKKKKGTKSGRINLSKKKFELPQDLDSFTFTPEAIQEEVQAEVPSFPAKKTNPKARPSLPWMEEFTKEKEESSQRVVVERPWVSGQDPVVRDFAVKEEMNRKGLKRAKKGMPIQMEDTHYVGYPFHGNKDQGLFCVFDGHGGKECSETLQQLFPLEMGKKLKESGLSPSAVADSFKLVYQEVDRAMASFQYVGSTATTVFVWEYEGKRYLQAANVGDSTSYLQRRDGVLCLSRDHKPNKQYERERIIASGISMTDTQTRLGGLSVSRALGDHFLKEEKMGIICDPYLSECIELQPTDSLLIFASDGLWDVLSGDRAMEIAHLQNTAEEMAAALMSAALANPKCLDNVTIGVVVL